MYHRIPLCRGKSRPDTARWRSGLANAVHQKYRPSPPLGRAINAVIARFSWSFPVVLDQ
jgi:hypothetical protein